MHTCKYFTQLCHCLSNWNNLSEDKVIQTRPSETHGDVKNKWLNLGTHLTLHLHCLSVKYWHPETQNKKTTDEEINITQRIT